MGFNRMRKNKILMFCQIPPPIHGVTVMNKYLMDSKIINSFYKIDFIKISYGNSIGGIGKINVYKLFRIIQYSLALIKKIIFFRPNLIYLTITPSGPAFLRDACYVFIMKLFRVKILYHLHGKGISHSYQKGINKSIYNFVFNNSDIILLSSKLEYDIYPLQNIKNIYFLPNGVSRLHTNFENSNSDKFRILFFANMLRNKGPKDLLVVVNELIKNDKKIEVVFAGEFDDFIFKEEFKTYIKENNLSDYVRYVGAKYNEDKTKLFQQSDLFVYPTYNDAFPLVILEAMSYGLPVISTDEGAISEIVDDNINGFIVDKRDIQQLVDRILFLYNNRDKLNDFGNSSLEKFKNNYSLEIFENNFKNILDKVME